MIYETVINEEALFDNTYKNPVYIVLMHSGTPLANAIKKVTGDDFSHACIAFNSKLDPLYSFGTKGKGDNGVGFSISDPKDTFFTKFQSRYSVYVMYVSDKGLKAMKERLKFFNDNKNKLKYDFIGLFNIWFGKDSEDHEKWFCSRFVMDIISKSQSISKVASLWKPSDITELDNISLVNRGYNFYKYDPKITERHCRFIKKNTYNPNKVVYEGISKTALNDLNSKQQESLSQYTKIKLTDAILHVYSKQYNSLGDVKINNDTRGYIWLDDNKPVAIINVEEKEDDNRWVSKFEIMPEYRGLGLSKQILKVAYKELKLTNAIIPKDNEVALNIFKSFGFKIYKKTDTSYFMSIERNMDDDDEIEESTDIVKEDIYYNTAQMVQSRLIEIRGLKFKLAFLEPINIDKDYNFAKYEIRNEYDIKDLYEYITLMNRIIKSLSDYDGEVCIPKDLRIGMIGYLYITKPSITKEADYYVNPAQQLKKKISRKKNTNDKIGNHIDAISQATSFKPNEPPLPTAQSGTVHSAELPKNNLKKADNFSD